ncbi:MAG: flavin reductase family protein [Candidatus Polarisedimenticolia bacterium]
MTTRRRLETKVEIPTDKSAWHPAPLAGSLVLVSSRSSSGRTHVSRKTWLTMVSSSPAMLALSCRISHRTAINILETREFVINVPGEDLAARAWAASDALSEDGASAGGWSMTDGVRVMVPRITECRAHLECGLESSRRITDEDIVFFGRIVSVSLDESLLKGAPEERYRALRSLLYLEPDLFAVIDAARRIDL